MEKVDTLKLIDTGLVPNRKTSLVFKYCKQNNLETVNDFMCFFVNKLKSGKKDFELSGLYDLLNYKYFNIINEDYLNILNSNLTRIKISGPLNKCYSKQDLEMLRRLGFSFEEVKTIYYFATDFKDRKIIDILHNILNPKNKHLYLGAYLETIFMEKVNLICKYYYLKSEIKLKYNKNITDEVNDLINKKNKMKEIKMKVIKQQALLNSLESRLDENILTLDEMIETKKKTLQNL